MSITRAHGLSWTLAMVLGGLVFTSTPAQAQFPGAGFGYGMPGMGFGMPGMGYGMPGMGFGMPGIGFGMAYPGFGFGFPAGFPAVLPYGGPMAFSPYANPMFGVGLSPLGTGSYFVESNMMGRAQLSADRRARARELLRHGR